MWPLLWPLRLHRQSFYHSFNPHIILRSSSKSFWRKCSGRKENNERIQIGKNSRSKTPLTFMTLTFILKSGATLEDWFVKLWWTDVNTTPSKYEDLYLNGVWWGVDLRKDTKKTWELKKEIGLHAQNMLTIRLGSIVIIRGVGGGICPFNKNVNLHFPDGRYSYNELQTVWDKWLHARSKYANNLPLLAQRFF